MRATPEYKAEPGATSMLQASVQDISMRRPAAAGTTASPETPARGCGRARSPPPRSPPAPSAEGPTAQTLHARKTRTISPGCRERPPRSPRLAAAAHTAELHVYRQSVPHLRSCPYQTWPGTAHPCPESLGGCTRAGLRPHRTHVSCALSEHACWQVGATTAACATAHARTL